MYKFLQLTDRENIPVYIIKAPVARAGYVEFMKEVEKVSRQHKSVKGIYNYNTQLTSIGLSVEDFFDSGHLNRIGAGKFTVFLTEKIGKKLNRKPDYSKVCYYKNESMRKIGANHFRYSVETFPNSLVQFIVFDNKMKKVKETAYGEKRFIDMERIGNKNRLYFRIKPRKKYADTVPVQQLLFKFMKDEGVLKKYNLNSLEIKTEHNSIVVNNKYKETPVFYTFVVFQNNRKIKELPYSSENKFSYEFKYPGKYKILAYVKAKDKTVDDRKALQIPINVEKKDNGLILKRQ